MSFVRSSVEETFLIPEMGACRTIVYPGWSGERRRFGVRSSAMCPRGVSSQGGGILGLSYGVQGGSVCEFGMSYFILLHFSYES